MSKVESEPIMNTNNDLFYNIDSNTDELFELLPRSISVYHHAKVKLSSLKLTYNPDLRALEDIIESPIACAFNINGDINGFACSGSDKSPDAVDDNLPELVESLFVEISNMVIGTWLTELDRKYNIFGHLLSPIVLTQEARKSEDYDFMSKMRTKVKKGFDPSLAFTFDYQIRYNDQTIKSSFLFCLRSLDQQLLDQ